MIEQNVHIVVKVVYAELGACTKCPYYGLLYHEICFKSNYTIV